MSRVSVESAPENAFSALTDCSLVLSLSLSLSLSLCVDDDDEGNEENECEHLQR
jgi:hypothetical protein